MNRHDEQFWAERYASDNTGWDVGEVTTPLKTYFDQLDNKELRILIPGAGNGYEAECLHRLGFKQVYVIDIAQAPLDNIAERVPTFPVEHLIHANFFEFVGRFDLIVEQTFFCALHPDFRPAYAQQVADSLHTGGKLVGVMFDEVLNTDHPPYGGSKAEYEKLLAPYFNFKVFEECYNSIAPRAGRELFVHLIKK